MEPDTLAAELGLPMILKPVSQGSSIGITKVNSREEIVTAWEHASGFEDTVIAEQWIDGEEYTVAVLDEQALPVIRLETPRTFYDFDAKYQSDDTQYHCPSGLPKALESAIKEQVLQAFAITAASGWGRVDLMLDSNENPWFLEINTVPGMNRTALCRWPPRRKASFRRTRGTDSGDFTGIRWLLERNKANRRVAPPAAPSLLTLRSTWDVLVIAGLLGVAVYFSYYVRNYHPELLVWPQIREVTVTGEVHAQDREVFKQIVSARVAKGFFRIPMGKLERELAGLPWVYRVQAQRSWPATLAIRVPDRTPLPAGAKQG